MTNPSLANHAIVNGVRHDFPEPLILGLAVPALSIIIVAAKAVIPFLCSHS